MCMTEEEDETLGNPCNEKKLDIDQNSSCVRSPTEPLRSTGKQTEGERVHFAPGILSWCLPLSQITQGVCLLAK
ncbi:hypothetical protein AV530_016609 [Patagioenas fasciata monilis]|uniref:Uncharacterized protein n=1 Tax=Patagioenas fasciata monilis TaxID=372326 RepID=A0A1V4J2Y7_PATFA|nr:hypothetical protein AV530_016609 [Patagioenas fasciata monilis]